MQAAPDAPQSRADEAEVVDIGLNSPQPLVVCRRHLPPEVQHRTWSRQISPIVARLLSSHPKSAAAEVHVTAVEGGDGASTVARQIAHTAARLTWCRVLLLDLRPELEEHKGLNGGALPDVAAAYAERRTIEVAVVGSAKAAFHAAAFRQPETMSGMVETARLRRVLTAAYDLIVTDCPPILDEHLIAPMAAPNAQVVLVLQGGKTRMSGALRAKQEISDLGGELFGAVLTRQRAYIPSWLDRILG